MKASEVLRRYKEGERDFRRVNLRGQSLKGQDLSGADFSAANLQGTNFKLAILKGVSFRETKAGLDQKWSIILSISLCLLSLLSGISLGVGSSGVAFIFDNQNYSETFNLGCLTLIVLILLSIFFVYRSISTITVATAILVTTLVVDVVLRISFPNIRGSNMETISSVDHIIICFIPGSVLGAIVAAVVRAIDRLTVQIGIIILSILGAMMGAVVTGPIAQFRLGETNDSLMYTGALLAIFVAIAVALLSTYVGWQGFAEKKKHGWVRLIAIIVTTIKGTNFYGADLTDADLTAARLKSTDFRKAKLIRTCFCKTKLLDRIRPGTSYLQHPQVRQLILTGRGQDKNFDRLNLRGINLKGTFLTDASFVSTDLSKACLQDADLSRVKLLQTQLDATDFTGATLTGAYIEDWGITNETNFRGVRCEYVYMCLPTKENPDPWRKPDNREEVFADGEFGDFIKPIVDTLDLYHNQGVDPRAIAISFKELAENNPNAELEIVAMERRGENKFLLRAKTAQDADKSQLNAEYFENYNQIKALTEQEVQALMAEKDSRIRSLENFVDTALKRPSFYAEGDTNMSSDVRKINIDDGNYNERIEGDYNQNSGITQNMSGGTMHGGMQAAQGDHNNQTIDTNAVSLEQKQTLAEAAAEIQALLEQLEKSYPSDTTTGKMALATEAIAQIDNNPNLTARILSALKVGGVKAFEKLLSHRAASFVIGALEDWQKTEGS